MRESYEQPVSSPEELLMQDLVAFHALIVPSDLDSPQSLPWRASDRLRASRANLQYEAVWAILSRVAQGRVDSPDEAGEHIDAAADSLDCEWQLFGMMPLLPDWLDYLSRFPSGEELAPYRNARRTALLRWFPHVHPSCTSLHAFLCARSALTCHISRAIASHVEGPYNCLICRRTLRALSFPDSSRTAAPRLAAATEQRADMRWQTHVATANTDRAYAVRYLDDKGYLRVFVQAEEDGVMPHVVFAMAVIFRTGEVMESVIRYPEQSFAGVNFGRLGDLKAEDVVGFTLRSVVEGPQ